MIPRIEIHRLLRPILGLTGDKLIWADQNESRPAKPFATLKTNSLRRVNNDHHGAPDATTGNAVVSGDREFTLSIQYFGPDAVSALGDFADKMQLNSTTDAFVAKKLIPFNVGAVTDVAELLGGTGGKIEPRAAVEVFFRYKTALSDAVGVIDTVVATRT